MAKLEAYERSLPYSYALGAFPSLQLIAARPEAVRRLLVHPDALESEGVRLLREKCAALGVREEQAERVLRRESKKGNCFAALVFDKYEAALDAQALENIAKVHGQNLLMRSMDSNVYTAMVDIIADLSPIATQKKKKTKFCHQMVDERAFPC